MPLLVNRKARAVEVRFGMEPDDGREDNTVYVKPRLTMGDIRAIERRTLRMSVSTRDASAISGGGDGQMEMGYSPTDIMAINLSIAVVDWDGPVFEGVKYRSDIWDQVDLADNEWWMRLVNEKINGLNQSRTTAPEKPETVPNGTTPDSDT